MSRLRRSDWELALFAAPFLLVLIVAGTVLYYRVSGDLTVCREHYPEMGRTECYFSSKTVRVPGGSK